MLSGPTQAYFTRGMRQFGVFLPTVSAGIGLKLRFGKESMKASPIYPTHFAKGSVMDVTLAGQWTTSFNRFKF